MSQNLQLSLLIKTAVEGLNNIQTMIGEIKRLGGNTEDAEKQADALAEAYERLGADSDLAEQFRQLSNEADTAQQAFSRASAHADDLGRSLAEIQDPAEAQAQALADARSAVEEADQAYQQVQQRLQELRDELDLQGNAAQGAGDAQADLSTATNGTGTAIAQLAAELRQAIIQLQNLGQHGDEVGQVGEEAAGAAEDLADLGEQGQRAESEVSDLGDSAKKATFGFADLGKVVAGVFAVDKLTDFAAGLIDVTAQNGRLRASLNTVTDSAEEAGSAWKLIQDFQADAPIYSVEQVTEAFIKLKALGLEPTEQALRSYGNTSAAMGADIMQFVEAVADAVTGEFERLKEFGIKASSQGEQVAFTFQGVTTTVGNNAKEIENYLRGIGETKFADGIKNQSEEAAGSLGKLSSAWEKLKVSIAESINLNEGLAWIANGFSVIADRGTALQGVVGKTRDELLKMYEAAERLQNSNFAAGNTETAEVYRRKLAEIYAELEKLAKIEGPTKAGEDTKKAAQATEALAEALKKATEQSQGASKAATDHSTALKVTFDTLKGVAEAERDAALASGEVQTALEKEGELRRLAVQEARQMTAAKEEERQKAVALVEALYAQSAAQQGGDDALKKAIATAEKDLVTKQQQAMAAKAHAAALDQLPDSLANVTREQELTNEQVSRYEEAARGAISHAQLVGQAFREGTATQAEYTAAQDQAQKALGTYTAALKLHVQQLEAREAAASRVTSLDQQRYQAIINETQARIVAANAVGDEAEALRLMVELKKQEAQAAQQLANDKAAEAQAALATAEAKAKELAANGELTVAEQEMIQQARDAAEAKRLEAQQSQSAADIKHTEADATERQAEAAQKAAKSTRDQADAQNGANTAAANGVSIIDVLTAQLAQYGESGVQALRAMQREALSFEEEWRAAAFGEQLLANARAQAAAVDVLIARIQSATNGTGNLSDALASAKMAVAGLDGQPLDKLQGAIDQAEQRMRQLEESARSTLNNIANELDQLEGNQEAVEQRNYEMRKASIEAQLEQARLAGDSQAQSDLQEAISKLNELHALKMKQLAGKRAKGGPVQKDKTYLIGEKRPETYVTEDGETYVVGEDGPGLFTAPKDGQVLPDAKSARVRPVGDRPSVTDGQASSSRPDSGMRESGTDRPSPMTTYDAPSPSRSTESGAERPVSPSSAPVAAGSGFDRPGTARPLSSEKTITIRFEVPGVPPVSGRFDEIDAANLIQVFKTAGARTL
jgi:hypothetical protein